MAAGGLLEPPHYTAVVAVGVTTRRVAGEVGSRTGKQTDMKRGEGGGEQKVVSDINVTTS